MGEYTEVSVYKRVKPVTPFSNKFETLIRELHLAGDNRQEIERLYRSVNFVHPDGNIFDLHMKFIEKDGVLYQSNRGIPEAPQLPCLTLSYKFSFPDFWMSVLKPKELVMDEHDYIRVEIPATDVLERFRRIEACNENRSGWKETSVYQNFYEGNKWTPSLQDVLEEEDMLELVVGHIYYEDDKPYRTVAKERITTQRKEIAEQLFIPHWAN